MKQFATFLLLAAASLQVSAQQYVVLNDELPIPMESVDYITYEADPDFEASLLPGQMNTDKQVSIFTEALRLTGLADTLRTYWYPDYQCPSISPYYYTTDFWHEAAFYNQKRYRQFTVFAETDETFAKNGIHNLSDLQAYAKIVYDKVYPEDASITDPTDRRNSLNRFVAYHILGHGTSYYYLTVFDGNKLHLCVNTNLTDIQSWYETLMPHAALKCSYPMGTESGLYLNHRGLKNGPDRYGKQVRGAKIVADGDKGFDHACFNGYYFHIDRILTYDQQTRDEVLGDELWRVDLKALSPDIMNNAPELRGNYLKDDNSSYADVSQQNGSNIIYDLKDVANITNNDTVPYRFVHRRAHANFWSWQGDEANIFGEFDVTIKLPPLPAGEWEVRMGYCAINTRGKVKVFLNDKEVIDTLDMTIRYNSANDTPSAHPRIMSGSSECTHFDPNSLRQYSFDLSTEGGYHVRAVLGRIQSDGKGDNYLRLKSCNRVVRGYNNETMLDYFEFVPKSVFDNTEIPEQ